MFESENLVKLLPPTVETCQPRLDGLLEKHRDEVGVVHKCSRLWWGMRFCFVYLVCS